MRAIGSLLGKTGEWGLDVDHPNIGSNQRPGSGTGPLRHEALPKNSTEAKERGNFALASGHYDEAVCM